MRNLTLALIVFVLLASQAQAQIGVNTYVRPGNEGETTGAQPTVAETTGAQPADTQTTGNETDREMASFMIAVDGTMTEGHCTEKDLEGFAPTGTDPARAQCFWRQSGQEYGKYTRFIGTDGNVAASTEVLSDVLYGVRIYVMTAISSESDDNSSSETGDDTNTSNDDAVAKNLNLLAASGGNFSIGAAYPIYAKQFTVGRGSFVWNATGRAGSTLQQLGISAEQGGSKSFNLKDLNGNLEGATEFQIDLLSHEGKIGLVGYGKVGAIVGTKKFAEALGTEGRNFWYHQFGVGIKLADMFKVFLTWNSYSDDKLPNDGAVVSVTLGK